MPRQTTYRFKRNGVWVDEFELADKATVVREMPHINLDFLPRVEELEKLEDDELVEFFFICESWIPTMVGEVEVGKKKCGHKFSSEDMDTICPNCSGEALKRIPWAFLKLYGTNKDVRFYVTDEMKVRKGLGKKYVSLAKQIIEKYGKEKAYVRKIV